VPAGPEWLPAPPYRPTLEQSERTVDEAIIGARDRVRLIDGIPAHQRSIRPTHAVPRSNLTPPPAGGRTPAGTAAGPDERSGRLGGTDHR
jgi:hypothetical protein